MKLGRKERAAKQKQEAKKEQVSIPEPILTEIMEKPALNLWCIRSNTGPFMMNQKEVLYFDSKTKAKEIRDKLNGGKPSVFRERGVSAPYWVASGPDHVFVSVLP